MTDIIYNCSLESWWPTTTAGAKLDCLFTFCMSKSCPWKTTISILVVWSIMYRIIVFPPPYIRIHYLYIFGRFHRGQWKHNLRHLAETSQGFLPLSTVGHLPYKLLQNQTTVKTWHSFFVYAMTISLSAHLNLNELYDHVYVYMYVCIPLFLILNPILFPHARSSRPVVIVSLCHPSLSASCCRSMFFNCIFDPIIYVFRQSIPLLISVYQIMWDSYTSHFNEQEKLGLRFVRVIINKSTSPRYHSN